MREVVSTSLPITREFYLCICNHSHAFIFKACLLIILMLCISISQSLNQTRICNTNKEHSNISSLRLLVHQQITMYIVAFFFFVLWDVYMWLKWSHISLPRLESVLLGFSPSLHCGLTFLWEVFWRTQISLPRLSAFLDPPELGDNKP